MQEKLVQVTETLGMVGYMTNQEMLVELYDANCTLVFCEGFQGASARLSLGDTAGSDIDWIQSTLETGGVNRSTTSDDSGRPMERTYVPVTDCGEVVGCIVTGYYPASGGGANEVAIEKAETFMEGETLVIGKLFAEFVKSFPETDTDCRFSLSCRCRINCCHENKLSFRVVFNFLQILIG